MRKIPLEPLSEDRFAAYGTVIGCGTEAPNFSRPLLDNWRLPFHTGSTPRLQIMRYHKQAFRLSRFERHLYVTETRYPMAGAAGILVVAGATEADEDPKPDAVRAFLLKSAGVMLAKGVWHGLDCFPLGADYADFLFLSDAATEDEIEEVGYGERTQVRDLAPRTIFEIIDPDNLIKR